MSFRDWFRHPLFRSTDLRRADLQDELQSHLKMATQERLDRGEPAREARASAHRELGNLALIKEVTQDFWGTRWLTDFLEDIRFGLRMLRKNPGFTVIAILTLAIGIGANTALFSLINGVLLSPLPYPHSEQLVVIHESKPNFATGSVPFPNFLDWQKDNRTFSSMAAQRTTSFIVTGLGEAEQLDGTFVTSDYFRQLGVLPEAGRDFVAGDDRVGAAPVVMITAGFWKRKFASSSDVIGKTLTLDGRAFTIIGVVPATFDLLGIFRTREVYAPIEQWTNPLLMNRNAGLGIFGIGRLKPGVTLEQARADMLRVTQNLAAAYPDTNQGIGCALIPLRERVLGRVQRFLFLLFGAVGFVLLIACVNIANLLLARSSARAREFAVRNALGAGKSRLVRQLITEGLLLALAGGATGLLLAIWAVRVAVAQIPDTLPRAAEVSVDARVVIFSVAVSLLTGILFSLVPAVKAARPDAHDALREAGRGGSGVRHRAQGILVAAEMALALVLLIGSGLMIRTMAALWNVDPGFNPGRVLTFGFALPPSTFHSSADSIRASLREVHAKLQAAPGVRSLAFSWGALPLGDDDEWLFWIDGQPKPSSDNEYHWALSYVVDPEYLDVMRIPLRSGRFFTAQDDEHSTPVAVVDDVFAQKYFPGENPIGKRLHIHPNNANEIVEIVGVVGHVKQWGLDSDDTEQLRAQLYTPFLQLPDRQMSLSASGINVLARASGSAPIFDSIRRVSQQMNSQQVVFGAQTMNQMISSSLAERRFSMLLLGSFAALALLLAGLGIYGVISYLVGQRTHEIGVRIAMGAQRGEVLRLVLLQGGKMAAIGAALGLLAALALTRLMGSMLYGVGPADPLTYFSVMSLLLMVALAACWLPALRASRVDPVIALRYE